jgi:hypothetical protein
MRDRVEEMAEISSRLSPSAGKASIDFFPKISQPYDQLKPQKLRDLPTDTLQKDTWWKDVIARGQADSPEKSLYFEIVRQMFSELGESIREVVASR